MILVWRSSAERTGLVERRKEGNSGEVELAVQGVGRAECEYVKLSSGTYS